MFDTNDYISRCRSKSAGLFHDMWPPCPRVKMLDGESVSIQADKYTYCTPRDNEGPYTHVELGFPSFVDERLMMYCEDPDDPTETVYAYVPVELVNEIVREHDNIFGDDDDALSNEPLDMFKP